MVKSLIPNHVEVYSDSYCSSIEKIPKGYRVTFYEKGVKQVIITKYLVGADGANSMVRRLLYPQKKIRAYMSIQQWFSEINDNPFYSCIFDLENTDCCSWSISKDNKFIFGGAFPIHNSRERFENQKKKLEKIGFRFGKPIKTELVWYCAPQLFMIFAVERKMLF